MPARSLALLATALLAFSWTGRTLARDRISVVHADDFPTIDVVVELSQGLGQITTAPGTQDVALLENGRPGPTAVVRKRFGDLDDGVAVVVLVDVSGSMRGEQLETVRRGLRSAVKRARKQDRVVLASADLAVSHGGA